MSEPVAAPAPLWLRIGLTAFVAFLVPYYWRHYGPQNFLWLSDAGLFLTVIALWRADRLLISMMAIGVLPLELFWNIDFFSRLITGTGIGGISDYMFDETLPLPLGAVSLFHVALPIIWIWLLLRWRYDTRAFAAQTLLLWALLIASYALTDPDDNINWVFEPREKGWTSIPALFWLIAYMVVVPIAVHWPLHKVYARYLPARHRGKPGNPTPRQMNQAAASHHSGRWEGANHDSRSCDLLPILVLRTGLFIHGRRGSMDHAGTAAAGDDGNRRDGGERQTLRDGRLATRGAARGRR